MLPEVEHDGPVRAWRTESLVFLVGVIAGACFGAADQYLGSLSRIAWASSVSLMSAPWLVLPFLFGCTQIRPAGAVWIGLVVTLAGLLGYGAMTLSPAENVHLSHHLGLVGSLVHSEARVIVGGLVTGPLYGWLGQRWRLRRAWLSAALVGGALLLEPLADRFSGRLPSQPVVWLSEFATGLALTGFFVATRLAERRPSGPSTV